jgi:hypothetical protein
MRFLLPVVLACALFSVPLKADFFDITFTGDATGSGNFSTNGACGSCTPGAGGFQSFFANFAAGTFDSADDSWSGTYTRATNRLGADDTDSENTAISIFLNPNGSGTGIWSMSLPAGRKLNGSFTFSAVPEPSSVVLFTTILALLGLGWNFVKPTSQRGH